MRKLITRKATSFSSQLFLCIFSTAFILLAAGLLVLRYFSASATTKVNNVMMEENLTVTAGNLQAALDEVDYLAMLTFSQADVMSTLKKPYARPSEEYTTIMHALTTASTSTHTISSIGLCDSWGNYLSTYSYYHYVNPGQYSNLEECKRYFAGMEDYATNGFQTWYFLQKDPLSGRTAFVNTRTIHMGLAAPDPLLVMYLSETSLSEIYRFLGEDSHIISASGRIISAVNKAQIGQYAREELRACATTQKGPVSFSIGGERYHAVALPAIDSYLIVHSNSEVFRVTGRFNNVVTICILMLGLVLSVLWAKVISRTITRPLTALKNDMAQVRTGDLTVRSAVDRQDEVGYLCNSFNYMMDTLNQHLEQRDRQQAIARENELQLMQAQINPHLLYNSLDSALFLLNSGDTAQSIRILEELSQFFRLSLQRGNKIVTIRQAIDLVETYFNLQNACRMKDYRLRVSGDLTLMESRILHMCLQPIVENCVLHGLEGNFSDGTVDIRLSADGGDILIRIEDNGVGMDAGQLAALREKLESPTPTNGGFGLWNVAQRLKMYYGAAYTLQVDSEFGEFTAVTLRIPADFPESTEGPFYV